MQSDPLPRAPLADSVPVDALALDFAAGQRSALTPLVACLWPMVGRLVADFMRRPITLPAPIDRADVEQEAVLIVARLAERWDPAGGHFDAYVRVTLPWELWRFVRRFSPGKRAADVRVDAVTDDRLVRASDRLGAGHEDGRRWDDRLIVGELLAQLDPLARRAVVLHVLEDLTLATVAERLGVSVAAAYRAYTRGRDRLRFVLGAGAAGGNAGVGRLVAVLHEHAGASGRLPGRSRGVRLAGLSELRYARLMAQLVALGCVVDRSARRPGRLAHPTTAESLAAIGVTEEVADGIA